MAVTQIDIDQDALDRAMALSICTRWCPHVYERMSSPAH